MISLIYTGEKIEKGTVTIRLEAICYYCRFFSGSSFRSRTTGTTR